MATKHISTLLCAAALCTLAACVDYNDVVAPVNLDVTVGKPADFTQGGDVAGKTVTLTLNGTQISAQTNAQGVASFTGIVPDVYTVSTTWEVSAADYAAFTGRNSTTDGASVTGTLSEQAIAANASLTLPTNVAVNINIVVGKVYFGGSKDARNRNYQAGRYIELFNQSDSAIDVSGTYIALLETESTPAYTLDNLHTAFADSVVLAKQVFRIPTDKPCIMQPGATLVIANSAVNHTLSAPQENDLSTADFEAKDVTGRTQNEPTVPALQLVYSAYDRISQLNLLPTGPNSIVLFRTDANVSEWKKYYAFGKTTGLEFMAIPVRYITDAVDILRRTNNGVDVSNKRLYPNLDASYASMSAATGYTGELLCRKVARRVGQRLILQDTNNSTNDFQPSTTFKIRQYE